MIKRTSLVWKRPELTDAEFRAAWLGEHAALARQIPGAREYAIDFIPDAPADLPSGIAVLRFDNAAALAQAFSDPTLVAELHRTRAQFAARVEVFLVDETILFSSHERQAIDH
jgi:uncharacterized protein (TIGR02118 family)